MIEQFMIAANVAVAALARRKKLPFIYRVHDRPDPGKVGSFGGTGPFAWTENPTAARGRVTKKVAFPDGRGP